MLDRALHINHTTIRYIRNKALASIESNSNFIILIDCKIGSMLFIDTDIEQLFSQSSTLIIRIDLKCLDPDDLSSIRVLIFLMLHVIVAYRDLQIGHSDLMLRIYPEITSTVISRSYMRQPIQMSFILLNYLIIELNLLKSRQGHRKFTIHLFRRSNLIFCSKLKQSRFSKILYF